MLITAEFDPANMYTNDLAKKARIKQEVETYANAPAGATTATIVHVLLLLEHTNVADCSDSNGPYTSRSDRRIYITADYFDANGNNLGRIHVSSTY